MPHYLFPIIVDEDLITRSLITDNITNLHYAKKIRPGGRTFGERPVTALLSLNSETKIRR